MPVRPIQRVAKTERRRKKLGLSAREFCKLVGLSESTYSRWVSGETRRISGLTLDAIEHKLGELETAPADEPKPIPEHVGDGPCRESSP